MQRREPDEKGPAGRAWLYKGKSDVPDHQATVAGWLLNVPGAHPLWQWWMLSVVHLHDIPGVRPAVKKYPEAEYEFIILSIDPNRSKDPDPDAPPWHFLVPADVVEQFHGVTDRDAARLARSAIQAIVNGLVSPDQDYRPIWKRLVADTARHFAEGKHPEQ